MYVSEPRFSNKKGFTRKVEEDKKPTTCGIVCYVPTLKRILKRLGIKRAGHNIDRTHSRCYSGITGEFMWLLHGISSIDKATETYDLKVRRDTVMRALSSIDPEGVERVVLPNLRSGSIFVSL